jgi:hypothetical protein
MTAVITAVITSHVLQIDGSSPAGWRLQVLLQPQVDTASGSLLLLLRTPSPHLLLAGGRGPGAGARCSVTSGAANFEPPRTFLTARDREGAALPSPSTALPSPPSSRTPGRRSSGRGTHEEVQGPPAIQAAATGYRELLCAPASLKLHLPAEGGRLPDHPGDPPPSGDQGPKCDRPAQRQHRHQREQHQLHQVLLPPGRRLRPRLGFQWPGDAAVPDVLQVLDSWIEPQK